LDPEVFVRCRVSPRKALAIEADAIYVTRGNHGSDEPSEDET
jgi:hypothetical protein